MKLGLALIIASALTVPSSAQSLGDISKKTQEDRDKAKATSAATPTKSYSDKDLKEAPAAAALAAPENAVAEKPPVKTEATTSPEKKLANDEAYWRARWMPVQQKLDPELAKLAKLNKRIHDVTFELTGMGTQNTRRGGLEAERQRLTTEVSLLDATIAADKAALAAIQEEGRRARALPGWFR